MRVFQKNGRRFTLPLPVATVLLVVTHGFMAMNLPAQQSSSAQTPMTEQERLCQAKEWEKEGTELFSKGQFGGAARACGKVYALYPDTLAVAFNYGYTRETLGQFEKAIGPLQKVVAARPQGNCSRGRLMAAPIGG